MRKWGAIAAVTAFAIFAAVDLVRDAVTNDPIGYYSREPGRLLYVAGIAVAGGLLTLGYYKLPSRTQRRVRMLSLGAAASVATAAFCYFASISVSLASMISKLGGSVWTVVMMLPIVMLLAAVAGSCWFACWRVWKTGASR